MSDTSLEKPWLFLDRNGTLRCEGCSQSYLPGMPVPEEIYDAILKAFQKLHWTCGNSKEPCPGESEEKKDPASGLEIRNINIEEQGLNIHFQPKGNARTVFEIVAETLGTMLDTNKAENYLSMTYLHPSKGELEVRIQRKEGRTPAEINTELRTALALALTHVDHGADCTPTQCVCELAPAVRARGPIELVTMVENTRKSGNLDFLKKLCVQAMNDGTEYAQVISDWLLEKVEEFSKQEK